VPEIDWSFAVIERLDPVTLRTSLIPFDLGKLVLDHDASQDLAVQPSDVITIFSQADIHVPQAQQTKLVRLEGEVVHAGYYSVGPGETLHDVVERAGGLTPAAYLFGAELTRESTRVAQQQRLDDYVSSLELEVDRASASTAAKALSAQDQAAASSSLGATQLLVSRLRQLRATGRIVLNMQPDAHQVASLPNLPLEDGDRFIVPSAPSSINVVGAVYDQNSFIFEDERVYRPRRRIGDEPGISEHPVGQYLRSGANQSRGHHRDAGEGVPRLEHPECPRLYAALFTARARSRCSGSHHSVITH
jgi:hypothetical protein